MSVQTRILKQKNISGNALVYVITALLVILILGLGYFIFTRSGVSPTKTPSFEQEGGGLRPKSLNSEKVSAFANRIENFNLTQETYQQAQIMLFNNGDVTAVGTENVTENNRNYTNNIKIQNDEGQELTYRFTQDDLNNMLVILARIGAGGGEKVGFSEIAVGDEVSIQNIINLLEEGGDQYVISIMRR